MEIIIQQTKAILSFILVEIFSTIYQRADVIIEHLANMSDCYNLLSYNTWSLWSVSCVHPTTAQGFTLSWHARLFVVTGCIINLTTIKHYGDDCTTRECIIKLNHVTMTATFKPITDNLQFVPSQWEWIPVQMCVDVPGCPVRAQSMTASSYH